MDKKFIKISLVICAPLLILIGIFTMTIKDRNQYEESTLGDIKIEYKDYKEDEYSHIITLLIENRTKDIATLQDIELNFTYKGEYNGEGGGPGDFYIKGYEEDRFSEDTVLGIDPGIKKEIIFKIPKSIQFDEEKYDLEHPVVDYNVNLYKFRTSKTSLMMGSGGMGGGITLGR